MASYHESATSNDTSGPKLRPYETITTPAITLVLDAIAAHCAVGGSMTPGVRTLADWAGVSAGQITRLLRQLDHDGWILYDGRVIMLLAHPDQPSDQAGDQDADRMGDQSADRGDQSIDRGDSPVDRGGAISPLIGAVRRAVLRKGADDQTTDRFRGHMVDSCLAAAVQDSDSAAAKNHVPCAAPIDQPVDRFSSAALILAELDADPAAIAEIRTAQPDLTPAEILAQWEIALEQERAGDARNARRLLFGTLKKPGGRLHGRATNGVAPLDPTAYAGDSQFRLGSDVRSDPAAERERAYAEAHRRALEIIPRPYVYADLALVVSMLAEGASEDQALDELAAERQARRGAP